MNGKKARSAASFFIGAILACAAARAQGPSAAWMALGPAHFRIHYPAQYQAWATEMASHIESVRDAVVAEVGFSPKEITDIVVMNPIADANGITLPLLGHPRIVLYTNPPEPE